MQSVFRFFVEHSGRLSTTYTFWRTVRVNLKTTFTHPSKQINQESSARKTCNRLRVNLFKAVVILASKRADFGSTTLGDVIINPIVNAVHCNLVIQSTFGGCQRPNVWIWILKAPLEKKIITKQHFGNSYDCLSVAVWCQVITRVLQEVARVLQGRFKEVYKETSGTNRGAQRKGAKLVRPKQYTD